MSDKRTFGRALLLSWLPAGSIAGCNHYIEAIGYMATPMGTPVTFCSIEVVAKPN